jgi:hypothetical protein
MSKPSQTSRAGGNTPHGVDSEGTTGSRRPLPIAANVRSIVPFAWAAALTLALCARPVSAGMHREWTNDIPNRPLVRIDVNVSTGGTCFAVEERLPANLEASEVTGGGMWHAELHVVRWGAHRSVAATTLTYRVSGPPGTYPLDGETSVNGALSFAPPATDIVIAGDNDQTIPSRPSAVSPPVIDPAGSDVLPVTVTVTCSTDGAAIHCTTNGAAPELTDPVYTGSVHVTTPTLLRARAFLTNAFPSNVRTAWFTQGGTGPALAAERDVDMGLPAMPSISLSLTQTVAGVSWTYEERLPPGAQAADVTEGGVFDSGSGVVRWGPFAGSPSAVVGYALTGNAGTYPLTGEWSVDGAGGEGTDTWVTVVGAAEDDTSYPVRPGSLAPPEIDPPGSTSLPADVVLTCASPGAEIRYTLDGTVPDAGSALFEGPVAISSDTWVRARAFATNAFPSAIRNAHFEHAIAPPELTVARSASTNGTGQTVVTASVDGVSSDECWTYEERLPALLTPTGIAAGGVYDADARIVRWGPFVGNAPAPSSSVVVLTYEVTGPAGSYAVDGGWTLNGWEGETTNAAITVAGDAGDDTVPQPPPRVEKPVFTPDGAQQLPVDVEMGCATPDAVIRYTVDGTTPTKTSAIYGGTLHVDSQTVLRAKAFKGGYDPSPSVTAVYANSTNYPPMQITRTIAGGGTAIPTISLLIEPPEGSRTFCVEETLSPTLYGHTDDSPGAWVPEPSRVRWGPFAGTNPVRVAYSVTGPPGTYAVWGSGSVDGREYATDGPGTLDIVRRSATFRTAIRVWLGGPYRADSNAMSRTIAPLLPATSPYDGDRRRVASMPTGICDWVFVELTDTNGTILAQRSMFVRDDGWVVDAEGQAGLGIDVPAWRYRVDIKHRNHLAVASAAPIALTNETVVCDFTTDCTRYAGGTNACTTLSPGTWGMIPGDVDGDGKVTPTDREMVRLSDGKRGYLNADVNLDGTVNEEDGPGRSHSRK